MRSRHSSIEIPASAVERLNELAEKNQEGTLSPVERLELDR
jgi:hypothetical protein